MSININIEKLKKDITSEDILASLFYYAVFGEKISEIDLERFKWHGIYAKDEKQTSFSLKIPLNLGELNLEQLESILDILETFSLLKISFKDGQKIEFDSLNLRDIPEIFNILNKVGLSSFFESSHSIKKVLTCPVNGLDTTQIFDVEDLAKKLNESFVENKNFFNLPNKLQFAISGYREGCDAGFTPDVSFNAFKNNKDKIVFDLKILDKVVAQIGSSQIIKTARVIAAVYRDFGNREKNSNFKEFIKEFTLESFCDILSSNLDIKIDNNQDIKILKEPKNALVKQYTKLFEIDGVELEFEDEALNAIVEKAIERKTGARGLRSIIEEIMRDIMFEIPSNPNIEKCIITKDTIQNNAKPKIIENPNKESKKKQRVQAEVKETA